VAVQEKVEMKNDDSLTTIMALGLLMVVATEARAADDLDRTVLPIAEPDRPLFVYFAPGATHAPHHVPKN
jgi:hypothetical protein